MDDIAELIELKKKKETRSISTVGMMKASAFRKPDGVGTLSFMVKKQSWNWIRRLTFSPLL